MDALIRSSLQVVDVSGCAKLGSINAMRSCVQLRCLRMSTCVLVSDLSPLVACSQLEELWMARSLQVTSLAPLKACPRLRKLDLRDCTPVLKAQVEDLQLHACTHLADPKTVEIEGLVHELQPNIPAVMQSMSASALGRLAHNNPQGRANIVDAGAIPLLVQLRGQSEPHVRQAAADALIILGVHVR
jgi:hypothetical protein